MRYHHHDLRVRFESIDEIKAAEEPGAGKTGIAGACKIHDRAEFDKGQPGSYCECITRTRAHPPLAAEPGIAQTDAARGMIRGTRHKLASLPRFTMTTANFGKIVTGC